MNVLKFGYPDLPVVREHSFQAFKITGIHSSLIALEKDTFKLCTTVRDYGAYSVLVDQIRIDDDTIFRKKSDISDKFSTN